MSKLPELQANMVTLQGAEYLLYMSGVKRGHSEALADAAANMRSAAKFHADNQGKESGAVATLSAVGLFRTLADQHDAAARACSKEAGELLGKAMGMLNQHRPAKLSFKEHALSVLRRMVGG